MTGLQGEKWERESEVRENREGYSCLMRDSWCSCLLFMSLYSQRNSVRHFPPNVSSISLGVWIMTGRNWTDFEDRLFLEASKETQPSTTHIHTWMSLVKPSLPCLRFSRPVCQPRLKREGNGRKIEGRKKKTSFNFSLFFLLLHLRCFLFWWQLYCQFNSLSPCLSLSHALSLLFRGTHTWLKIRKKEGMRTAEK